MGTQTAEENGLVAVSHNVPECSPAACMSCSVIVVVSGPKLVSRLTLTREEGGICSRVAPCSVTAACFDPEHTAPCRSRDCF